MIAEPKIKALCPWKLLEKYTTRADSLARSYRCWMVCDQAYHLALSV